MTTTTALELVCYNSVNSPTMLEEDAVIDFLFEHLGKYGDPKPHIRKCIEYACSSHLGRGGFVIEAKYEGKTVGAVIVNQTGMEGYIPENILVYIAVDADLRGKGIGKTLMSKALELAHGDVALHVEPDNPAKHLYEKLGFSNKYLEMRYSKK